MLNHQETILDWVKKLNILNGHIWFQDIKINILFLLEIVVTKKLWQTLCFNHKD